MESSPPTQTAPLSSVLPTSGLPESMTVGECFSFFHLSASYYFSLSLALLLRFVLKPVPCYESSWLMPLVI